MITIGNNDQAKSRSKSNKQKAIFRIRMVWIKELKTKGIRKRGCGFTKTHAMFA
jgi:glycine/serine hydroxymethyltransferase